MITPNMFNWYWIVGGTGSHSDPETGVPIPGDETRRFSSKVGDYVPADDETYLQWVEDTKTLVGFDPTTRIESEESLIWALNNAGVPVPSSLKATK